MVDAHAVGEFAAVREQVRTFSTSADILNEALSAGVDTLIVGEGAHWTAVVAEENDLAILYAGHYATETVGVRALSGHLSEKFGLPWSFVSAPTGL
jgi:putative NIF3 family GTP cyclohydrolase 1 type 2